MFSIIFLLVVLVYNSQADIQTTESQMVMRQVKVLKCSSDLHMTRYPGKMVAYQNWNQVYVAESGAEYVISHLQPVFALTTTMTVELEKFDNNTDIYTSYRVQNASNARKHVMSFTMHCSGTYRKLISLVDDGFYQYKIDNTLTYDGTKIVKFSCQENEPTVVAAWINSAGDRIFPYKGAVITLDATEVHNASMLCCVYYTVTPGQGIQTVQRFVKNKTLLIYRKGMANAGVQPSGTISDTHTSHYVIVIISSISALVLILLVSIVAIKTCCWKKKDRSERPRAPCQLPPNEPASHMPFYVNLLFRRECEQEIRAREEPQYEEIIYQ